MSAAVSTAVFAAVFAAVSGAVFAAVSVAVSVAVVTGRPPVIAPVLAFNALLYLLVTSPTSTFKALASCSGLTLASRMVVAISASSAPGFALNQPNMSAADTVGAAATGAAATGAGTPGPYPKSMVVVGGAPMFKRSKTYEGSPP